MQEINRETKTSVHFHLHYVLAMPWIVSSASAVGFQKALLDHGLEFAQTSARANGFVLTRNQPSHLQVKVDSPGPQLASIGILSANPSYELDMFARDAEAVTSAYRQAWPTQQCQIIRTTAKIHHLYCLTDHAFKYLWETRLGQKATDFESLGKRPVAGGGLRLLIPPHTSGPEEPRSIEIRMESLLQEPKKMLIETIFVWPKPRPLHEHEGFEPAETLREVDAFATNEVWAFLTRPRDDAGNM